MVDSIPPDDDEISGKRFHSITWLPSEARLCEHTSKKGKHVTSLKGSGTHTTRRKTRLGVPFTSFLFFILNYFWVVGIGVGIMVRAIHYFPNRQPK